MDRNLTDSDAGKFTVLAEEIRPFQNLSFRHASGQPYDVHHVPLKDTFLCQIMPTTRDILFWLF